MLSPVHAEDLKPGGRHQVFSHCHRRAADLAWRWYGEVRAALTFALDPLWTGIVCCRQLVQHILGALCLLFETFHVLGSNVLADKGESVRDCGTQVN